MLEAKPHSTTQWNFQQHNRDKSVQQIIVAGSEMCDILELLVSHVAF